MARVTSVKTKPHKSTKEPDVVYACLSYLGPLALIPLLLEDKRKDPFVRFHLNQGLVLLLFWIANSVLYIFLIGWFFAFTLLIFFVFGIVSALQKRTDPLPFFGKFKVLT